MEQERVYKGVSIVEAPQPGEDCLLRRALGRMLRCFSEALGRFLGGAPRGSPTAQLPCTAAGSLLLLLEPAPGAAQVSL